jgi:hypothetical protein
MEELESQREKSKAARRQNQRYYQSEDFDEETL